MRQQSVRPAYDVDSAMARATLLRRQNRKAEAERVMAQAVAMAPGRADARALHEQLRQETRGGEAMAAAEVKTWREQLPEWREAMVSLRKNTGHGPVAARVSRVDRGPLSDDRLQVEAYPAFPRGYFAFGAALATERIDLRAYHGVRRSVRSVTDHIEGSVGYRRMNFDDRRRHGRRIAGRLRRSVPDRLARDARAARRRHRR